MPMQQLSDLTRRLAAAAARVDAADLTTLGTLHTCLAEINRCVTESAGALFRHFHTLKGVAGFLKLGQITALAHAGESLLDLARHERLQITGAAADLVLEAVDAMKVLLASLEEAIQRATPIARHPA